ncbi:MAG TPA: hypothetical protein VMK65_11735 [Longimicrobiales bacterium]|nr:hypothetical protein [Longimicrobiales bacterium]
MNFPRRVRWPGAVAAVLLLGATPALAQEWGVVRQSYLYADTRLVVNVRADVPGEIQLVRGSRGWLDVAARADRGIAGMALGGHRREELVLTSMGAERVLYLVTVPENTRVDIRLPGTRFGQAFWPPHDMARYTWGQESRTGRAGAAAAAAVPDPARVAPEPVVAPQEGAAGPREAAYTAFAAARAPLRVEVPAGAAVRTLVVRVEPDAGFRVETGRPMSVTGSGQRYLRVHPRGEPMDVVLILPTGTRAFALYMGDAEVLRVADGQARALCAPVTEQRLGAGRHRFSFSSPASGMECGGG